jgi:cyclohexanone monooxygenase
MTIEAIPVPQAVPDQTKPVEAVSEEDRAALRNKYLEERDKRIRPDGAQQYKGLQGILKLSEDKDPYTEVKPREPLSDHVEFLFLGGGFAALSVCARLKDAGFNNMRILDSGGNFGGVW